MKEIKLTKGRVALIDDADFDWLNQWKWHAHKSHCTDIWYAVRTYRLPGSSKKYFVQMHRLITNAKPGEKTDHKDGDGLNNQRYNLRKATNRQNSQNKTKKVLFRGKSASKYIGVQKYISHGRDLGWRAVIGAGPPQTTGKYKGRAKRIPLGYFSDEIEAAKAYDQAAKKYFEEFAHLNFP
jgi:hypothetical protein